MRLAGITSLIASAAAAGAIAAPAAVARFDLNPGSSSAAVQQVNGGPNVILPGVPPVLPPPRASDLAALNRAKTHELERVSGASGRNPIGRYSNAELAAYPTIGHPADATAPAISAAAGGFDYGDAAIGAGVIAVVALLITAAALAVRRRSQPHAS